MNTSAVADMDQGAHEQSSPQTQRPNVITRFLTWWLPRLAERPARGRRVLRFSPVFTYSFMHPETAYGIEPVYGRWLWVSPAYYVKEVWKAPISLGEKLFTVAVGLTTGVFWTLLLHQAANNRDVRWRARQVARALETEILDLAKGSSDAGRPLIIDVLGAGSGCYMIDAILRARQAGVPNISCRFIDKDPGTYQLARQYAHKRGLDDREFERLCPSLEQDVLSAAAGDHTNSRHIVLLIGLGDHIDKDPRARERNESLEADDIRDTNRNLISLYRQIHDSLVPNGRFITSFISHNGEERFLTKVAKWRHRHRSWEMVQGILKLSGWEGSAPRLFTGPFGIQHVVVVQRDPQREASAEGRG